MTHDVVIRRGQLVDGTGAEPVAGDLAIDGGLISAVGEVPGSGEVEIEAEGMVVSPGFVDLHTHLDAQIGWDPLLTPVSWHGVTTALMGNCGVTFAPCKPEDRDLLAGMMETVEDIPKDAILGGLPWDWEGYGGYLDSVEKLEPAINLAGLVGHCAVRFYVMGERAVEEQATEAEKQKMAEIVGHSLDRGAVGFSTNRYPPHVLPDGRAIPGTYADADELLHIARAVGQRNGLMQNVLDFSKFDFSTQLLRDIARASGSRVLFSFGVSAERDSGRSSAAYLDDLCADGLDITAISQPRGSGFVFGLQATLPARGSTWNRIRDLDLKGRLAAIRDAETAGKLVQEAKHEKATQLPLEHVFWMGAGESPAYAARPEQNLLALANGSGEHWSETFLRLSRESDGKALFTFRMFNLNLDALGDMFKSERIFPSLGDAGAHVSQIMDAGWATFVLSHWVRETGLYTLGEAIRRLTSAPARIIGLADRGRLAEGLRADVNIFDPDKVAEKHPEIVHDFPGGAPRFIQKSMGYQATLVNGQISVLDGEHTGARAGAVLRHAG
ncbi:MAG TPA: amidohydrolase [Myxococcales bacterium]|jgi:N-acyl-D-aspartate/D-glutamate deacylase|nr:amidohydrolase [Myxococcales bacterium]